jgi:hypothetical protein
MHAPCLLRENFHIFCPQWLFFYYYYYYPQWIFTMSPQREFSWVLSSVASFLLFSPVDLYRVSPKRIFMDFALNGFFSFIIPSGFSPCLLRENFHGSLPSVASFILFSPVYFYHVSLERIFMEFCPQWPFHFHPQWIPCLLREYFHEVFPQWFLFYFKSPTVLSSKDSLLLYCCDA